MATDLTLVIGNKNLSSWSLRPWLALQVVGTPFKEQLIRLDEPETRTTIGQFSPSGLVPCLLDGGFAVWDSLAICEYLAELFPDHHLWPEDPKYRARARSLAAQMHSGFGALRNTWPMEFNREGLSVHRGPGVKEDTDLIVSIWEDVRKQFGEKAVGDAAGPFLMGRFSIVDAMFAPVVSRFKTYGPFKMSSRAEAYMNTVWCMPEMQDWGKGAAQEIKEMEAAAD